MENCKRILAVSRDTKFCKRAVQYGISLSWKYDAELYVLHVAHDPFTLAGWNLPLPSLDEACQKILTQTRADLAAMIATEHKNGLKVKELTRDGSPTAEILQVVKEKHIDLVILLAHEEGRLEHFLFGRSNEELIRTIPCSIVLVKTEVVSTRAQAQGAVRYSTANQ